MGINQSVESKIPSKLQSLYQLGQKYHHHGDNQQALSYYIQAVDDMKLICKRHEINM